MPHNTSIIRSHKIAHPKSHTEQVPPPLPPPPPPPALCHQTWMLESYWFLCCMALFHTLNTRLIHTLTKSAHLLNKFPPLCVNPVTRREHWSPVASCSACGAWRRAIHSIQGSFTLSQNLHSLCVLSPDVNAGVLLLLVPHAVHGVVPYTQ